MYEITTYSVQFPNKQTKQTIIIYGKASIAVCKSA